jgi:hypothetical protein
LKLIKPIGGDFDSASSIEFALSEKGDYEFFFPETLAVRRRAFFETATDSLAAIVLGLYTKYNLPINLRFPVHYCFETIFRLDGKLKTTLSLNYSSFASYTEIKFSPDQTNIILFNHFNVYNDSQAAEIHKFRENGWETIEDFVHAPLDITRTTANHSFNSLRKLTDIEVSVAYSDSISIFPTSKASEYYKIKKQAAELKADFLLRGDASVEEEYLGLFKKAENLLNRHEIVLANPDEIERLKKMDWHALLRKRIINYNYLSSKISTERSIRILPGKYMYVVARPNARDELRRYMFKEGIYPAIHWPDSESEIKYEILSFHIDQRYGKPDLDRTIKAVQEFYSNN